MKTSLRLLILLTVSMMTVLDTGGPIAAFATTYGYNGDDDSLADRIIEDVKGMWAG